MGMQNRKVKCSWCWTIAPFSIICLSQGTALFTWRCLLPKPQLSASTVTNYKQQSLSKRRIISPPPSPAKRHEMKCCHTCFHRDGITTSLIGSWRHLKACVPVVLRLRCPKEQGWRRGAPAAEPEAGWDGGGCLGGWWSFLQGKASCGGTLQCLQWPQDVSQMQKHTSGWCSSGIFLEKSSKDHLLHAERRLHIGYRCYQPFGQLWLTVKSIGGENALQDIDGRCIFFRLKNTLMLCLTFHYVLLLSELRCS